jgi:hypothetical protein
VVFHNGTAYGKILLGYALTWKGSLPSFNGPSGYILLNNSLGSRWTHVSFDLYRDFTNFFGFDPAANHFCVNYILLYQENWNNFAAGSNTYSYFDDVELDELSQ